jgi:sterol 3beta-glucosyltransferase
MKIVIPTIGTRGDVQPYIALAQGLERTGHSVLLMSHPFMGRLVESHGVAFAPMGPDIDIGEETAAIRNRSQNVAVGLVRVMRFAFDMLERSHEDILTGCRGADLVVVPANSAAGRNEADLLDLPYASVNLMPWSIPVEDPDCSRFKRLLFAAAGSAIGLITTRPLNRMRRRQGLPPVGPEGFTSTRLDLVPVSPAVYAADPRWAPHHRVVGYWFVKEPGGWQPPADLIAFLEQGQPPLVVSLGAMGLGAGGALATASLFVAAIQQAGVRAIVQGWDGVLDRLALPPAIHRAGSLPHSWLLPRAAGVVHHGGFGTTAAGLRAGIPALVIPHIADQFYWGQRVHELGAGPMPIRRSKLEAGGLATALADLAGNDELRATASLLGETIRAENGVENAVRLVEETFGR